MSFGIPREIVWMVRTNTTENPWEQDIAIPNFEKENPDIKVNLLIIDQPDIAMKREAIHRGGHGVLAHTVMDVIAGKVARLDYGVLLGQRADGACEIG